RLVPVVGGSVGAVGRGTATAGQAGRSPCELPQGNRQGSKQLEPLARPCVRLVRASGASSCAQGVSTESKEPGDRPGASPLQRPAAPEMSASLDSATGMHTI